MLHTLFIFKTMDSYSAANSRGCLSSSLSPPTPTVHSPCAACKILRRRCVEKCVLAPYFPPTDPLKFTIAHRVFGASNIIKFLQELPVDQRADAVNSMVYEASARLRDPVYGCAGAISHLQKQIGELQVELAKAQAEILNMQCQNASLFEQINTRIVPTANRQDQEEDDETLQLRIHENPNSTSLFGADDQANLGFSWEPLWS